MSKKKIRFSKLLFEFISVSFAVLLALFVNQWREDRNNDKLAKQAILNIKEEIKENKSEIYELIINHKTVLKKLDSIAKIDQNKHSEEEIITDYTITLINSSAWDMAKVTNAIFYINFDIINNLAKVYNFQSYYESIIKHQILSDSNRNNNEIDRIENTRQFLNTIIPMEEDLQEYYEVILSQVLIDYNN